MGWVKESAIAAKGGKEKKLACYDTSADWGTLSGDWRASQKPSIPLHRSYPPSYSALSLQSCVDEVAYSVFLLFLPIPAAVMNCSPYRPHHGPLLG